MMIAGVAEVRQAGPTGGLPRVYVGSDRERGVAGLQVF